MVKIIFIFLIVRYKVEFSKNKKSKWVTLSHLEWKCGQSVKNKTLAVKCVQMICMMCEQLFNRFFYFALR